MELTTVDADGDQATRMMLRGRSDHTNVEFYRGGRGNETLSVRIEGGSGFVGIGTGSPDHMLHVQTVEVPPLGEIVAAIHGVSSGADGASYGVSGESNSPDGAGVRLSQSAYDECSVVDSETPNIWMRLEGIELKNIQTRHNLYENRTEANSDR
jgi:hypothetical protein